jgi:hypothetical protein
MGRKIFKIFVLIFFFSCSAKKEFVHEVNTLKYEIPQEYKSTALITSSTYQVYYQVHANSYVEGLKQVKKDIVNITLEYLLKEPFLYANISYEGKMKIRKMIEQKGKMIYFKRLSENQDLYEVVFHFTDYDLRNQLRNIK